MWSKPISYLTTIAGLPDLPGYYAGVINLSGPIVSSVRKWKTAPGYLVDFNVMPETGESELGQTRLNGENYQACPTENIRLYFLIDADGESW